ncbi:thioredoxin h [Achlya hypogyna]|uniref:Thioredoxin n=1 Tax=Achlya hypogyna TaxID=1202772 RepID=A0A1V9Z7Z9_ACHHY|nr:thioredoxin h [Achlya hypogyna]
MAIHTESLHSERAFRTEINQNKYKDRLVVVDFSAAGCLPCQNIKPIVDGLARDLDSEVEFIEIDVDDSNEVADALGIHVVPMFQFFRNGKRVDTVVGANPAPLKELVAALK